MHINITVVMKNMLQLQAEASVICLVFAFPKKPQPMMQTLLNLLVTENVSIINVHIDLASVRRSIKMCGFIPKISCSQSVD